MDLLSPRTSRVGIPTARRGWGEKYVRNSAWECRAWISCFQGAASRAGRSWFLNPRALALPQRMTYSQAQAARLRKALAGRKEITEKEMFGGIAFLLGGNMCVGIHGDDLIVRIEPSTTEAMLREPGAKPFDLAGARAMAGWLLVAPAGYRTEGTLPTWGARGGGFASSLPKKRPSRKR